MNITNPILRGCYPDPSVCCANGTYYMVHSTFELYPGIPIWESKDLINWKQIGHCLHTKTQAQLAQVAPSRGIWAPTIRYHNGTFYVCTVNMDGGGNFFVTAQNPHGPWSEPIFVPMKSIDPSMFFEQDNVYFMTPQTKTKGAVRGIYMAEIDVATGKLLTEERLLWQGSGGKCLEAPHLYHIGDYYYLFAAEGGTEYGHGVTVARSKALWGPYESCPNNPIVTNRDDHDNPLQCAGHADLVQAPDGSWAIILLASRWGSKWHSHLGRETCLLPVVWQDNWPQLPQGHHLQPLTEIPWAAQPQLPASDFYADFTQDAWDKAGVFLRNPHWAYYCKNTASATLQLTGAGSLSEALCPTFYGYRQPELECTCQTFIDFSPQQAGQEAGLTVYLAPRYHFDIAVTCINGEKRAQLRQTVGQYLSAVTADVPVPDGALLLEIQAQPQQYTFFITDKNGSKIRLGHGETKLLSNETAKLFTGVCFGIYCVDCAQQQTATFWNFNCRAHK